MFAEEKRLVELSKAHVDCLRHYSSVVKDIESLRDSAPLLHQLLGSVDARAWGEKPRVFALLRADLENHGWLKPDALAVIDSKQPEAAQLVYVHPERNAQEVARDVQALWQRDFAQPTTQVEQAKLVQELELDAHAKPEVAAITSRLELSLDAPRPDVGSILARLGIQPRGGQALSY